MWGKQLFYVKNATKVRHCREVKAIKYSKAKLLSLDDVSSWSHTFALPKNRVELESRRAEVEPLL